MFNDWGVNKMSCKNHICRQLEVNLSGRKVGLLKEGFEGCEEDVQNVVRAADDLFRSANIVVEEVSMPMHTHGDI